jgi:UDP-glucose 4-epimerase
MVLHVGLIGASGFVGRALALRLSYNTDISVSLLSRPDFDLERPETYKLIDNSIDVLVHAAGAVGPSHPETELWATNVISTYHLVSFLNQRNNPPYLMYLSTGGVSGDSDGCVENASDSNPKGLYALTKYVAEQIISKQYLGAKFIPRLYFPYGPGQAADRLVPNLIRRVMAGQPVHINNDGRPVLSLVYIDDLVDFLERVLIARVQGVMNVAGATRITIGELVTVIEGQLGKSAIRYQTGNSVLDFCAADIIHGNQTSIALGINAVCRSEGAQGA